MSDQREDTSPRVLVVDDEELVTEIYSTALQSAYEVDTATSGAAALEQISEGYDVVLLDQRMPEVSGDEVLAEIHRRDIDCQVIMVTAVSPDPDNIDLQCTDYVIKPVGIEPLREAVERALQVAEYSDRR